MTNKINNDTCIFPGSFNPFHLGHFYIITSALKSGFKKIYVAISMNEGKEQNRNLYLTKNNIERWLKHYQYKDQVEVVVNYGLTTTLMDELNINWIIRGYRNQEDYDYELQLFNWYKAYKKNIKYRLIKSHPTLINMRSSYIRYWNANND